MFGKGATTRKSSAPSAADGWLRGGVHRSLGTLSPAALGSWATPEYTLNGKKVEVAIKQIIAGKAVEQRGAFSNPEALRQYWDIPELQGFGVRLAGTGWKMAFHQLDSIILL
ncbi:acetoacetyl-CoA synthetase-like [Papio anubis]|uniref:acetoacetyl-CoA synthetase-like n=1 Tax=Papio anubis TaxID=9555 RepID=UPI0012AD43BC|nr:acetoacetyl-CoA synthetase-like [Papio anubis]